MIFLEKFENIPLIMYVRTTTVSTHTLYHPDKTPEGMPGPAVCLLRTAPIRLFFNVMLLSEATPLFVAQRRETRRAAALLVVNKDIAEITSCFLPLLVVGRRLE